MNISINKLDYRDTKLHSRLFSLCIGVFGIYKLRNVNDEFTQGKYLLGVATIVAGLVGVYSIVAGVRGKSFKKYEDFFKLEDTKIFLRDAMYKNREIFIADLQHIVIERKGTRIYFVTTNQKITEVDLIHFNDDEKKRILETITEIHLGLSNSKIVPEA